MMNKAVYYQYKAILWKEIKESCRLSKYAVLLWAAVMLTMLLIPVAKVHSNKSIPAETKGLVLGGFAVLIPMMLIPIFGQNIVQRSIYEERRKKTIQTLMAQGVCPTVIWFGKVSAAIVLSCAVCLIASVGYSLIVRGFTGYWVTAQGHMLYATLFVSPIISASILSLVSSCYMVLKQPKLLTFVYVMGTFYGMFYAMSKITSVDISVGISSIILAAGFSLLGVSYIITKRVSRERVADT